MKYYLVILFFLSCYPLFAQGHISGKVTDSETGQPLAGANIIIEETSEGTSSEADGSFQIPASSIDKIILIRFIGYRNRSFFVKDSSFINIALEPSPILSQSVLVEASIGIEGTTPAAFSKLNKEEIRKKYSVQDVPQMLSSLPSAMFYSENGNGIGYNYLNIRGFDQRRITVTINGIPQNDPEDHNVYWLDFPDLLGSTKLIQVQRGAGGIFGYPSVGGTVNIITSGFTPQPEISAGISYGSFVTRKYSASFSSGLIDGKYNVYGSLSQILSSGYRDLSWVKFNSYHLSAARYDKDFTTQINFFGGPVADGLAYTGLPKFAVKDKDLRRANYSYWEADSSGYTYTIARRPEEKENFSQPHFELLNDYRVNDNINLNSALFLVLGNGFFDYDGSWGDTTYFRLTAENGFAPTQNPGNALIRAMVENTQYGWIPRISIKHRNGELLAGTEIRVHRSLHWGSIQFAENLPAGVTAEYKYYSYRGAMDIFNGFVNERYSISSKIDLTGELQAAYHKYRLYEEMYLNNDFSVEGVFFNPKAGINYRFNDWHNLYFSFARVTREPRLKNYYDAAESSGGEVPMFEHNPDGSYNFDNPLVKPETMNDFELGTYYSSGRFTGSLNLFYMLFTDEIVKNGKIDKFGQPVTGNMPRTLHRGVEANAQFVFTDNISLLAGFTYCRNTIEEGSYFIDAENSIDLNGNRIGGFPDVMGNAGIRFTYKGLDVQLTGKYIGKFYSDNYDNNLKDYLLLYPGFESYSDNVNDAYFTADISASYELNLLSEYTPSRIFIQLFNITNNLYSAYAIGKEFFPSAGINIMAGLQVGL